MPTSTSSNGLNVNTLAHKENQDQNASLGGTENLAGRNTTPLLGAVAEPSLNSGFSVGASVLPINVKKIDYKDLKSGADYRPGSPDTAKSSVDQIANSGGTRKQMRGQQNSRNYNENGKSFESNNDIGS